MTVRSFVRLFVCSFVRSFVRLFVVGGDDPRTPYFRFFNTTPSSLTVLKHPYSQYDTLNLAFGRALYFGTERGTSVLKAERKVT